jgi:hypothetical protein
MRWLALLLLVLSLSAQADDALQSCLYLARQAPDKRLTLAKDCPALFAELENQNVLATSEPSLSAELSLSQLEFLADSLRQNEAGKTISTDGLDPLLASIVDKSQDPETAEKWWQAFLKSSLVIQVLVGRRILTMTICLNLQRATSMKIAGSTETIYLFR